MAKSGRQIKWRWRHSRPRAQHTQRQESENSVAGVGREKQVNVLKREVHGVAG